VPEKTCMCKVSEGRGRNKRKDLQMKPLQTQGLRAATEGTTKATATVAASLATGCANVTSPRRTMPPECPTPRNPAAPPPPSPRTSPLIQPTQWPNMTLRAKGSGWLWKRRWPLCSLLEQTQTHSWATQMKFALAPRTWNGASPRMGQTTG